VCPCIQNVGALGPFQRAIMIFFNILKKVRIPSQEEKKWYGHSLWTNVPGHFHKARVNAHAAVQRYQGIDTRIARCRKQT